MFRFTNLVTIAITDVYQMAVYKLLSIWRPGRQTSSVCLHIAIARRKLKLLHFRLQLREGAKREAVENAQKVRSGILYRGSDGSVIFDVARRWR